MRVADGGMAIQMLSLAGTIALNVALSSLVSLVGFILVAPTAVGRKIINVYFDRQVIEYRHRLNNELEEFRNQLQHTLDRGVKSNEREYSAISRIWKEVVAAYFDTNTAAIRVTSVPEFGRFSEQDLEEFLKNAKFSDVQKRRIRGSDDKKNEYLRQTQINNVFKARKSIHDARLRVQIESVFIPDDIRRSLLGYLDRLSLSATEQYFALDPGAERRTPNSDEMISNAEPLLNEQVSLLRARLMPVF